jgi:spore germination cell wall hydrolase CwlJ-like protein
MKKTITKILFCFLVFILGVAYGTTAASGLPPDYHDGEDFGYVVMYEEFWQLVQDSQAHCLALNIYHESRSDNLAGQFAVADVVLNRVEHPKYPNTICEVVYQAKMKPSWKDPEILVPIRNKCQFSWYCDGKSDLPRELDAWTQSQYVAYSILKDDHFRGLTEGATHYHTTYVSPTWNKHLYSIGRIGSHVFFRSE